MKRTITLHTFRKIERQQETLVRAAMPRTAAADPARLDTEIQPALPRRVWCRGVVTKSGFTLAEVAHVR